MPLQNRVDPFSQLHAVRQRGAWMGNRGILHDEHRRVKRFQMSQRWIICELEFQGIRREVMKPRRYTELFFLDEATALAAGHRPCNLCRREAAREFLALSGERSLADLDRRMHPERMNWERLEGDWRGLPNGAMIAWLGLAYLVWDEELYRWSFDGYRRVDSVRADAERELEGDEGLRKMGVRFSEQKVMTLTRATTLEVLKGGYLPQVHPSVTSRSA